MLVSIRRRLTAVVPIALLIFVAALAVACDGDTDDASPTPAATVAAEPTAAPAGTGTATGGPGEVTGEVEWEPCPFEVPDVELECGSLNVYADRAAPDDGVVRLRFAVARTPADEPAGDPVVYLSGGPGQSALELAPVAFGRIYAPLMRDRDLVIVDQRGVGLSEPSLSCDEFTAWARESLQADLAPEEQAEQGAEAIEQCRLRLVDEGVDFSHYTSAASAADLDELRRALGHDQWNVYGNSYGTRLALTVMRDHPEGVRSVVLDAAYPVEADLYAEIPGNAARAFDAFFAACAGDTACARQFPALDETFQALVDRLNAEPAPITVLNPMTGERFESDLDGDSLVGFLFQSLYATDLIQFLPEIIAAADEGEFGTIGILQGAFISDLEFVSIGMQLSVQCHEEVPFIDAGALSEAAAEHPLLEGYLEGALTIGPEVAELCAGWRTADPELAANDAVTSDIPTLILSGSLDPITPPRWGELIAGNLPNSHFFEFPHTGHGVVAARDCAVEMTQAFLEEPGAAPAAGCIDDIPAPAFTPAGVEITMVPFTSPSGFTGFRPEGWTELLPGFFQESVLVAMVQQVAPGITEQQLLQQIATQLGRGEPEAVRELETEHASWRLYELIDLGQAVDLAVAEHEGALLLVQLNTPPLRRDVYYEQAFLPALEGFDPGGLGEAAPGAAPATATATPAAPED